MKQKFFALFFAVLAIAWLHPAQAETKQTQYVTDWAGLLPKGLYDFFPEDMSTSMWLDPAFQEKVAEAERKIRPEVNNRPIILPGYMVALSFEGDDVYEFLLVPSAGQCIHVPPPPVNQTIYVKLDKPTKNRTYGQPIIVDGTLLTDGAITEYAETGYRIEAEKVEDFTFDGWRDRVEEVGAD